MKEWLDMMLEKVSVRVSDEGGSTRDKAFKETEKKRLQTLIDRHDGLMPKTVETQEKVEIYAACYSYGDDLGPLLKTLEEMLHLSTKEIHPHNVKMVEEQVEKMERVNSTVETVHDQVDDFVKKGQKLIKTPNCAPFLAPLVEKLQTIYKEATEKAKERLALLRTAVKDWEKYDEMRTQIIEPCDRLENEFKLYKKIFDPKVSYDVIRKRRLVLEECKARANDMFKNMQKSYTTIVLLAGEDKREFLDREVNDIDEKRNVIAKCELKLKELEEYNEKLVKAVEQTEDLKVWSKQTAQRLQELRNIQNTSRTREERVKESICLQEECKKKLAAVKDLDYEYRKLLPDIKPVSSADYMTRYDVARKTMAEFEEMKKNLRDTCAEIEKESGSISDFFGRVQELCKEWNNMKTLTDALINSVHSLNPITNPGVAQLETLFKKINSIHEKREKIMAAM
ncbi:hypothetical protein Anas_12615 [Armadillidium nasatum]|uniref:Uncharacterized protein n=1 Tax=Armadillidium nasatum TaxID=96803 RepID=A0A5N5T1S3_9CRUS|nr:hypothetical protein Anas_12615 [Armadillidium nasatum]